MEPLLRRLPVGAGYCPLPVSKAMRLRVKLFAFLTRYRAGLSSGTPFEVDLPEGATLADLLRALQVPDEEVKMTFVNGLAQTEDWQLKDGDEVGIFPPIAGG